MTFTPGSALLEAKLQSLPVLLCLFVQCPPQLPPDPSERGLESMLQVREMSLSFKTWAVAVSEEVWKDHLNN